MNGATGNPLIEVICGSMHECMKETMRVGILNRRGKNEILEVADSHAQITDAIEKGSEARAVELMKKHFDEAMSALRRQDTNGTARKQSIR